MKKTADTTLQALNQLVGTWTTEATHPAVPGVVVHGTVDVEWLEGERFLIHRARTDHPEFPDSVSIIGHTGHDRVDNDTRTEPEDDDTALRMHYYDSRGVFRVYEASVDDASWRFFRDAPRFGQRFTGLFADGGDTIVGRSQVCEDGVHWVDDLAITYRRQARRST